MYLQILGCSNDLLTTPALVQLKVTLLMRAGIRKHDLHVMWEALTDEQRVARRALWTQMEQLYALGIARFKDDPKLRLHYSTFYYFHVGNKPLAHREASSALRLDCPFDVEYFIFLYRTRSGATESTEHSAEVNSYIEFKELSVVAENASRLAARSLVEFWSELLRGSPVIERLFRLSNVARAAMISANGNYERLLEINPSSVQVLRTYGGFVLDFLGDISASSRMLHRADEVEELRSTMTHSEGTELKLLAIQKTNLDVYDERNAVISISLDSSNFAKIVSVNSAARRIFGYSSNSEMLGQNVNVIIPEPTRSVHDEILQAFLYRNEAHILNSTRVVLAVHKKGYVMPLDANIRWADTVASRIIGVLSPVYTDDEQLIFDKTSDQVTYATLNAYSYFGFSREMIVGKEVVVSLLFPHLSLDLARTAKGRRTREELVEQAHKPRGLLVAARNHSDNTLFLVRLWTYTLQMHTVFASVARISRKVDEEHLRNEENVLGFTKDDINGKGALSKDVAHLFSVLAARKQKRGANSGDDQKDDTQTEAIEEMLVPVPAASPVHTQYGFGEEDETEESDVTAESLSSRANGVDEDEDEDEDEEHFDEDDLENVRSPGSARPLSHTRLSFHYKRGEAAVTQLPSERASLLTRSASPRGQSTRALPTAAAPNTAMSTGGQKPGAIQRSDSKAQQRLAASASLFQVSGRTGSQLGNRVEARSGQVGLDAAGGLSTSTSAALLSQKEVTTGDLTGSDLNDRRGDGRVKAGPGRTDPRGLINAINADMRGTGQDDGGDSSSDQGADRSTFSAGSGASSSIEGGNTVMGNRAVIAFVKNRVDASHKVVTMSRNLGHIVIALIGASLLATYFLVDAAITDNNVALSAQTLACHRRHLAMNTGLLLPSALSLTSMGFYETSRYAGYLQRLVTSIDIFRSLNAQLYHMLPPTDAAHRFMYVPSLALLTRHPDGKIVELKVNMKEYVELYVRQAAAVATTPLESLTPEASADLYSVTRNGMETAPVAFERAAVYYQDYVDQIYGDIGLIVIAILVAAIAALLLHLLFSVYRTVVYCEHQSEDVVLLLLSLPRSVVRLIQRRYVTTLRNQGEEEEETLDLNDTGDKRAAHDDDFDRMSSSDVSSQSGAHSYDDAVSGTESAPDTALSPNSNDKNPRLARNRVSAVRKYSLIEYVRSRRIRIALRFALLFMQAVTYVVVVVVQVNNARISNLDATRDIAASTQRQFALVNARYAARKYMVGIDTQISHDACLAAYETLNKYISALAYGDEQLGLKGNPSPAVAAQLFSNPCVLPADSMVIGPTERTAYYQKCSTYRNGFARRGAQELLIVSKLGAKLIASDVYRECLAAGLAKNANSTTVPYQPTDPFYIAARKVLDDYISILRDLSEPIMTIATDIYRDDAHRANEQLRTFLLIFFICGCIIFAAGHLFIFTPVFHALFTSVRTSHALLFAIPPDVATKLPQLSAFLAESSSTERQSMQQTTSSTAVKNIPQAA